MNGIINMLKPAGMTSHDVVSAVRRILGIKKAGHTGTLDPMAVGVLPVCIGTATRIMEYLDGDYKGYRCEAQLGLLTDTEDIWGHTISKKDVIISPDTAGDGLQAENTPETVSVLEGALRKAIGRMHGDSMQTPPQYSAVRVGGRRLYEYARSGETVQAAPRPIHVRRIGIVRIDFSAGRVAFDVESSKGSYIRTICTAIGEDLGCGAAMRFLARTASGRFRLEDAVSFEELEEAVNTGRIDSVLLPADYPLSAYPAFRIMDRKRATAFINGGPLDPGEVDGMADRNGTLFRLYYGDVFIAMARWDDDRKKILSDKVFCRGLDAESTIDL